MKKANFIRNALVGIMFFVALPANATVYSIKFYENLGLEGTPNLFMGFRESGSATFEISNSAVSPNNLVLFTDPDFVSFDALMTTSIGNARFTLGIDDFPPKGDGSTSINYEQGILFDATGEPLRFDTPVFFTSNSASICDPSCFESVVSRDELTLWDENDFDAVFLNDGTITSSVQAIANGDPYTRIHGHWGFSPIGSNTTTGNNNYYVISSVPIPPALWMLGSGLIGLVGIRKTSSTLPDKYA